MTFFYHVRSGYKNGGKSVAPAQSTAGTANDSGSNTAKGLSPILRHSTKKSTPSGQSDEALLVPRVAPLPDNEEENFASEDVEWRLAKAKQAFPDDEEEKVYSDNASASSDGDLGTSQSTRIQTKGKETQRSENGEDSPTLPTFGVSSDFKR